MSQIVEKDVNGVVNPATGKFFTVKKFAEKNRAQGTWPDSESAIWALRAESPQNGFREAFITVGRRVLIAEQKFWEAVASLQEARSVSKG